MPAHASWGDEWGRVTRFLESARIAFAREHLLWGSLDLSEPACNVTITTPAGKEGTYSVRVDQHLAATSDEDTLFASVLIHSYSLAEAVAGDHLGHMPPWIQIEAWGKQLLENTGRDWSHVHGGFTGAVEVAVIRNTLAHGSRTISAGSASRLTQAGLATRPAASVVSITYDELREHRSRLLSLLRVGGVP